MRHKAATIKKRRQFRRLINGRSEVKLHLGAESVIIDGYINIDIRHLPNISMIADINDLSFIADGVVDQIYTSHTLEHVSHQKLYPVLREWRRVLKPSAALIVSVPDFDKILHIYNQTGKLIWHIKSPLMGEQDYPDNTHYAVFNRAYLEEILLDIGFSRVRELRPEERITDQDWSFKKLVVSPEHHYDISLNMRAEK